jgi:hypothetical protein
VSGRAGKCTEAQQSVEKCKEAVGEKKRGGKCAKAVIQKQIFAVSRKSREDLEKI